MEGGRMGGERTDGCGRRRQGRGEHAGEQASHHLVERHQIRAGWETQRLCYLMQLTAAFTCLHAAQA